jgi:hypothetical protein
MKPFSIALCVIGVLVTALGVLAFYGDDRGQGVAGFVFGVGIGSLGVLLFVTDFTLRIFRRTASLMVRFRFCKLSLEIHGELGSPVDEIPSLGDIAEGPKPATWAD